MKKISSLIAILIVIILTGCSTAKTVATESVNSTATAAPTSTVAVATPIPTSAPIPLYKAVVDLDYDPADYGFYSISWEMVEGGTEPEDVVWPQIVKDSNRVRDLCSYSYYSSGMGEAYVSNIGDMWSQEPLTSDCVAALAELSGRNDLEVPNQGLNLERVVNCDNGKICEVLSSEQIQAIESDLRDWDFIVSDPSNNFYSVQTSGSRLEPNSEKYPGYGLKFLYPTTIVIDQTGVVPQIGITNWGKTNLCFVQPGWTGGEGGIYVPGGSEKCVSVSDFPEDDEVDPWAFLSQGRLDSNTLITWAWKPSVKDGVLTIRVVDVDVTRLEKIDRPVNIGESYEIDQESGSPVKFAPWTIGEEVIINNLVYSYQKANVKGTNWSGWWHILEGMEIVRNGNTILLTGDFNVVQPCESGCVEVVGEPQEDLIGETITVHYVPDQESVWFESDIPR